MNTIAVDFDGVLHAYSKGWHDGTIYDPPIDGALDALLALMEQHAVFIFTTREPEQVAPWLQGYGFTVTTDEDCARCLGCGHFPPDADLMSERTEDSCGRCKGSQGC
jgi:hypothetical protein